MAGKKAQKKNSENEKEAGHLKDQLVRALADYDNLRKRVEIEKASWFKFASAKLIERFLPILDMLSDAQKHVNDQGLAIVIGEFQKVIDEEGFLAIKIAEGETDFDSLKMEAVEAVKSDDPSKKGKVAAIVQSGWQSKNEEDNHLVIRPAKVKVYE